MLSGGGDDELLVGRGRGGGGGDGVQPLLAVLRVGACVIGAERGQQRGVAGRLARLRCRRGGAARPCDVELSLQRCGLDLPVVGNLSILRQF